METPLQKKRPIDESLREVATATKAKVSKGAVVTAPPKKARTQYIIFKDLVKSTPEGSKLDAKALTVFTKEKSTSSATEWADLWRKAANIEREEAAGIDVYKHITFVKKCICMVFTID